MTKESISTKLPFDAEKSLRHLSSRDKRMSKLIEQVGPLRLELMEMHDCYESLLESIVYQQLTGKAAATIMGRVKAIFADSFPSPAETLACSDERFRAAGLSRAKTAAIKDLAQKCKQGCLPSIEDLEQMTDDEIIESLTQIRGIGEWTVQMLLIFKLGRPDVMPATDYGVRKGFARVYKKAELPTVKELKIHAEKWRPFRSVASWYLWRSLELN